MDRKMECAQLIILLYYWQFQNQDVEADVPQINLEELAKDQYNWDTISLSSFDPTLCFFMTFVGLIVTIMYTLLVTILARCSDKHISHLQKILKRDKKWRLSKK